MSHSPTAGHERIAAAAAQELGLTGGDGSWSQPTPLAPAPRRFRRVVTELVWTGRHLLPALARRALGRSSGDGLAAKRPELLPVDTGQSG
jgi:hypothetical protein